MGLHQALVLLLLTVFYEGTFSLPVKSISDEVLGQRLLFSIPNASHGRQRRAGEEQSGGGSGAQEVLTTAIKDGIAASSAVESPTMVVGGISLMIQPMPKGSEVAGQLTQMAPHFLQLIPGLG